MAVQPSNMPLILGRKGFRVEEARSKKHFLGGLDDDDEFYSLLGARVTHKTCFLNS